jgi:formylglycine-generating enzyme required for sulfatase activity
MDQSTEPPRTTFLTAVKRALTVVIGGADQDLERLLDEAAPEAGPAVVEPPAPPPSPPARKAPPRRSRAATNSLHGFDWVTIPRGPFLMGSDPAADPQALDSEQPQHQVLVEEFHIARLPVTIAQFAAFIRATGYRTTAEEAGWAWAWLDGGWQSVRGACWARPLGQAFPATDPAHWPVTQISWHDAQAFCAWANVRLPTEREWEKAARGVDGRLYPWGNQMPEAGLCNCNNIQGGINAAGQCPTGASPYGVLDMSGNTWEWCASKWRPDYTSPPDDDPTGPEPRVVRGGSFNGDGGLVRCAARGKLNLSFRDSTVGFRVVAAGLPFDLRKSRS